jgi:hypothetical protein
MFDEPEETPSEEPVDPAVLAKEKAEEFRVHAQLAAVFEGCRKFEAQIIPGLDAQVARDIQRTVAKLEKSKPADIPALPETSREEAAGLLDLHEKLDLSTNDYHIHRRPGEVMIVRWLEGMQVDSFYKRLQAHFDAGLNHFREEERQANEWRKDAKTLEYLKVLDAIEMKMADRYLRDVIKRHNCFVLSTQSADEMDILHLCDYVMGVPAAEVVGAKSAPPSEPTDADRTWYFKLFSLRGMKESMEQMCFFAYLQKTDDSGDSW